MTHFFYSLRREQNPERSLFLFYFDTHIITQVNLELKHSFFDKVALFSFSFSMFLFSLLDVCHWGDIWTLLWPFYYFSLWIYVLLYHHVWKLHEETNGEFWKSFELQHSQWILKTNDSQLKLFSETDIFYHNLITPIEIYTSLLKWIFISE